MVMRLSFGNRLAVIVLFDTQELIVILLCLLLTFETIYKMFSETSTELGPRIYFFIYNSQRSR